MPNKGYATVNTKTNKLQGIDMPSGGYPFDTDNIQQVKIWYSKSEAIRYLDTGLRKERNLALVKITLNYEYEIIEDE